jgi:hypothetical protein
MASSLSSCLYEVYQMKNRGILHKSGTKRRPAGLRGAQRVDGLRTYYEEATSQFQHLITGHRATDDDRLFQSQCCDEFFIEFGMTRQALELAAFGLQRLRMRGRVDRDDAA